MSKHFRVWIEEVGSTCINVEAANEAEAKKKASDEWCNTLGKPRVYDVREMANASKSGCACGKCTTTAPYSSRYYCELGPGEEIDR